ncbi:MAG: AraC family transcriptional regulator, partial [Ruthenibacterium sp.]
AGKIIDEIKFLDNFNQILMNKLMIFGIKEIFPVNNNTYVFMTEIQQEKNQIQEIISTINFAAETYLNCSLFMGVSLPCDGVGMLATGTVQALAAREQQFYTHETNLCVFEEKQQPDIMEIFSPKAEDELYHSLLLLQTDHAIAVIEHCLNVCKKHQVSMSGIDTLLERINLIFSKTASKCFVELEQLTPEQSLPAAVCAEQFESVFELEQRLIDDVNRLVKIISVAKKQNYHDEIRKIKSYIEKNYMNDISLEMVAKHVGMSRNYTSSIFKKSTGENLVDYLNRFRIEKAYCFIIEENKNVSQAAEMVGFNNINYFSNMFKKIKGINPSTLKRKSQ